MGFDLNRALGLEDPVDFDEALGRHEENNENNFIEIEEVVRNDTPLETEDTNDVVKIEKDESGDDEKDESVKIEKEDSVKIDIEESGDDEENLLHTELISRLVKKEKLFEDDENADSDTLPNWFFTCEQIEEKLSVGKVFPDLEKVYLLYCEYARFRGFSVRKGEHRYFGKSDEVRWKQFHCSCTGLPNYASVKHRLAVYKKLVTRTDCKAKIIVSREDLGPFFVTNFENEHNHGLVRSDQSYLLRSSRNLNYAKKSLLDALNSAGIGVSTTCKFMENESGGVQNVEFTRKDAYHHVERNKKATKVEDGDAWLLVDYLTNKSNSEPFFYWKYELDDDGRIMNIFWRDTRCVVDYDAFGDVLSVDTTFRTNKYNLIAAPFVGINHHTNNVMFGMALMSDETTSSFKWLFETFLDSMHGKQPKMIFTDQCRAMMNVIDITFPKSKHRLCQWHISKNCAQNFGALNGDSSFKSLWYKCMKLVETEDDFDKTWAQMMRYEIKNPNWYLAMHKIRHRWASVFTRGFFSAGVIATSRSESTNQALKSLVEAKIPLIEFVRRCEEVLTTWRLKESAEDTFAIWLPGQILQDNALLIHAATVYTRTVYKSFEFALTNSFNVVLDEIPRDLGDGNVEYIARPKGIPDLERTVVFNSVTKFATCSCGYWETEGLICSHIIKVFDRKAVDAIPENMILQRWTKVAKKDLPSLDDVLVGDDTSLMKYMIYANETMRYLYELVSSGFKNDAARSQIVERMKSLRVEFSDILSGVGRQGSEAEPKTTPGGQLFRDPKKVGDRFNVRKSDQKSKKRTPKSMAALTYQKKPKNSPRGHVQRTINFMQGHHDPFDGINSETEEI